MPDLSAPIVYAQSPTAGQPNVPTGAHVMLDVLDPGGAGLDPTSIQILINAVLAYDGGAGGFQPGFNGLASIALPIPSGLHFRIEHSAAWAMAATISVQVLASDLASNSVNMTYEFTTLGVSPTAILEVYGTLTDEGRRMMSRQLTEGLSWNGYTFQVGGGGFDVNVPSRGLPVDSKAVSLIDLVFGVEPVDAIQIPNDYGMCWYCVLEEVEANFELGEIAIYATVNYSPADAGLLGQTFMIAHAQFPARFKNPQSRMAFRICVQCG